MYLGYQNGQIKFYTEQQLNHVLYQIDKSEFTNDEYVLDGDCYILKDEAWEEKQALIEKERVAQLNMTRGDFIEGLILALGKDENDVIALIETLEISDVEKKVYINRVKNALDFYRGYPVIDVLCGYLGLTTEQMTQFFETKDYKHLIPIVEEEPTDDPLVTQGDESESIDIVESSENDDPSLTHNDPIEEVE